VGMFENEGPLRRTRCFAGCLRWTAARRVERVAVAETLQGRTAVAKTIDKLKLRWSVTLVAEAKRLFGVAIRPRRRPHHSSSLCTLSCLSLPALLAVTVTPGVHRRARMDGGRAFSCYKLPPIWAAAKSCR
jgi:hypothetical protein